MYDLNLGTNHFTFVKNKYQPNHPAYSTFLGPSICRRIGNSGERDTWSFLALLELNTGHMLSEVSKTLLEGSISTLSWHGSCRVQCSCVALCQYCSGLAVCCIRRWGGRCVEGTTLTSLGPGCVKASCAQRCSEGCQQGQWLSCWFAVLSYFVLFRPPLISPGWNSGKGQALMEDRPVKFLSNF